MVPNMPDGVVVLLAVATPLFAFVGATLGPVFAARADDRLDTWRRREETMRMLRWGAENAVSKDGRLARVGVAALTALASSELLQPVDDELLLLVTEAVLGDTVEETGPGDTVVVGGEDA
jgi:hypothetical protein